MLVTGETGTGKELIVRAIHDLSRRREKILVKVNCAALPAGVIESELFGHEKGAFTGALTRKIGRFELAHGGTLFLDEIGDLPLELQAKLLRVLQEGEFERVGGTQTLKVHVRLVAATNRDLAQAVSEGKFRADLFYRLNVFPIHVPPLRERLDDVPRLVRHFVMLYAAKMGKKIGAPSDDVVGRLRSYHWPGNVREMQNVIERAVILASKGRLELGRPRYRSRSPEAARPDARGHRARTRLGRSRGDGLAGQRSTRRRDDSRTQAHDTRSPHEEARHRAALLIPAPEDSPPETHPPSCVCQTVDTSARRLANRRSGPDSAAGHNAARRRDRKPLTLVGRIPSALWHAPCCVTARGEAPRTDTSKGAPAPCASYPDSGSFGISPND